MSIQHKNYIEHTSYNIRDLSLITARGGYKMGGGAREVLLLRKGGGGREVLAMLKGGGGQNKFCCSFYAVA